MDTRPFEDLGLTKGEIKVYLALLELGLSTTGNIVKKSGVSTSKVYKILDKLIEKGLVSYVLKRKAKHFKAAEPAKILDYVERKERALEDNKKEIANLLPSLKQIQDLAEIEQQAVIYEGMEGLKTAFDDILNTLKKGDVQLAFGAGSQEKNILRFFHHFHLKREKQGIKARIIFNRKVKGTFASQENSPSVEARYIEQTTPAAINIYADSVIIALLTKKPVVFLIKSKEVSDSFRSYFDVMWKIAKK